MTDPLLRWLDLEPESVLDQLIQKYPNEFIKDHIILICGDSFSNGDELADDQLPIWKGYFTTNNEPIGDYLKFIEDKEKLAPLFSDKSLELWKIERERVYAGVLQRELPEVLVINLSQSGAGPERNARILSESLIYLKNKFPNKRIDNYLGLSPFNRTEWWKEDKPISSNGSVVYSDSPNFKRLVSNMLKYQTEDKLFDLSFRHLTYIALVCEKFNCSLTFISNPYMNSFIKNKGKDYDLHYAIFLDKYFPPLTLIEEDAYIENGLCLGRHYGPVVHELFGKTLAEMIRKWNTQN